MHRCFASFASDHAAQKAAAAAAAAQDLGCAGPRRRSGSSVSPVESPLESGVSPAHIGPSNACHRAAPETLDFGVFAFLSGLFGPGECALDSKVPVDFRGKYIFEFSMNVKKIYPVFLEDIRTLEQTRPLGQPAAPGVGAAAGRWRGGAGWWQEGTAHILGGVPRVVAAFGPSCLEAATSVVPEWRGGQCQRASGPRGGERGGTADQRAATAHVAWYRSRRVPALLNGAFCAPPAFALSTG